jgi:hypothetical protein
VCVRSGDGGWTDTPWRVVGWAPQPQIHRVELAELPAQTAVDDQPAVPRRVRLGFAAVLPASTSSGLMFVECPATELSAEYDGGVAYLQSAAAGGRRYVLDPVELAAMCAPLPPTSLLFCCLLILFFGPPASPQHNQARTRTAQP